MVYFIIFSPRFLILKDFTKQLYSVMLTGILIATIYWGRSVLGILSAVVYLLLKKTLRSRQPVNVRAKIGTRSFFDSRTWILKALFQGLIVKPLTHFYL